MEKITKLIPMTAFVLQEIEQLKQETLKHDDNYLKRAISLSRIERYASFLTQPLSLEQFVPCEQVNGVWVPMEEPKPYVPICTNPSEELRIDAEECYNADVEAYQAAKERCLFSGWHVIGSDAKENHYQLEMINENVWIDFYEDKSELTITNGVYEYEILNAQELMGELKAISVQIPLTPTALKMIYG